MARDFGKFKVLGLVWLTRAGSGSPRMLTVREMQGAGEGKGEGNCRYQDLEIGEITAFPRTGKKARGTVDARGQSEPDLGGIKRAWVSILTLVAQTPRTVPGMWSHRILAAM